MYTIGINGQITVTVVSNPVGTSVTGSPNTFDYPILSTVNLTCMVDPSPSLNASYRWNTTNCYTNNYYNNGIPGCFPHGKTAQTVTGKNLTAEDAGTVTCTVTINGTDFISTSFTLRISGKYCSCYNS